MVASRATRLVKCKADGSERRENSKGPKPKASKRKPELQFLKVSCFRGHLRRLSGEHHCDLRGTLRPKPDGSLARYKASSDGWPRTLSGGTLGGTGRTARNVLHGSEQVVKRISYSPHFSTVCVCIYIYIFLFIYLFIYLFICFI